MLRAFEGLGLSSGSTTGPWHLGSIGNNDDVYLYISYHCFLSCFKILLLTSHHPCLGFLSTTPTERHLQSEGVGISHRGFPHSESLGFRGGGGVPQVFLSPKPPGSLAFWLQGIRTQQMSDACHSSTPLWPCLNCVHPCWSTGVDRLKEHWPAILALLPVHGPLCKTG